MSDFKSKLPDLKEVNNMVCKFAGDMKISVMSIVADYKKNHPSAPTQHHAAKKEEQTHNAEVKPEDKKE